MALTKEFGGHMQICQLCDSVPCSCWGFGADVGIQVNHLYPEESNSDLNYISSIENVGD